MLSKSDESFYDKLKVESQRQSDALFGLIYFFYRNLALKGRKDILKNKYDLAIQYTTKGIYRNLNAEARRFYSLNGEPDLEKMKSDIRALIICHVIRLVKYEELNDYGRRHVNSKIVFDLYDINDNHLERLSQLNLDNNLTYEVVESIFGKKMADRAFYSLQKYLK